MESGTGKLKPLLSIAVPTWNRAESLEKALNFLLPQTAAFNKSIEIIISDNASNDHTPAVIATVQELYPNLKILTNRNEQNLGFHGNLMKCREVSTGKYFWVLSDDDYVREGLMGMIMQVLSQADGPGVVYLKTLDREVFQTYRLDRDQLLLQEGHRIGLISAVIFLNYKEPDNFLNETYKKSAFIGLLFLLNAFIENRKVEVIEGPCLKAANEKPKGYNFFDIFINHMQHVIDYMKVLKIPSAVIMRFRSLYLRKFISLYYLLYKGEKRLKLGDFKTEEISSTKDIEQWTRKHYADLRTYWTFFYPLTLTPPVLISTALKLRKTILRKTG